MILESAEARQPCAKLCPVRAALTVAALLATTAVAGCGGQAKSAAPPPSAIKAAFKGSPAPLAGLHTQANQLLGGGTPAFRARLAALHGHPVIVNLWASWCGPCRYEFPAYQKVAVDFGRRIAFLGVDEKDHNGPAGSFLEQFPVT